VQKFDVHILGCGSAKPTTRHNSSCQVVDVRDKLFMIDCGEGAQVHFRRSHLHFKRLNHIFISHLHGDHCFGLIGLISTLGLLGRTADLHIYAPNPLPELLKPQLAFFCDGLSYRVKIHPFSTRRSEILYEDRSLLIETVPLLHRMPCCGFIFREKATKYHLDPSAKEKYQLPLYAIHAIKAGEDYVMPSGEVIPNSALTLPMKPVRSYAYISDTAYKPDIVPRLKDIDCLYHEATFLHERLGRAVVTQHSTALQAGLIADAAGCKKLVIGHFSARYHDESVLLEESKTVFSNTELANEGMIINV